MEMETEMDVKRKGREKAGREGVRGRDGGTEALLLRFLVTDGAL